MKSWHILVSFLDRNLNSAQALVARYFHYFLIDFSILKKSILTKKRYQYFQRKNYIPRNYVWNPTFSQSLCVLGQLLIINYLHCWFLFFQFIWYKMNLLFIYSPNKANWQLPWGWPICNVFWGDILRFLSNWIFQCISEVRLTSFNINIIVRAWRDYITRSNMAKRFNINKHHISMSLG